MRINTEEYMAKPTKKSSRPIEISIPPPPPTKDIHPYSWVHAITLIESLNHLENTWRLIEEVRTVNPEEAGRMKNIHDGPEYGIPGAVWWARDHFKTLQEKGPEAALEEFLNRLGWDPSFRLPQVVGKLLDSYEWPENQRKILEHTNYAHYQFALWAVLTVKGLAEHLKQCRTCGRWFFAPRRDQAYCDGRCRDRYWNRSRRRQAHHNLR